MPAMRSINHRFGQERAIQFEMGARREPSQDSFAMWPNIRLRRGSPLTR
jgi:hypothetical protein